MKEKITNATTFQISGSLRTMTLKGGSEMGTYRHGKGMVEVWYDKTGMTLTLMHQNHQHVRHIQMIAPTPRQVTNRARKFLLETIQSK